MKVGMLGVISNPSISLSSHNAGWTFCLLSISERIFGCKIDILTENDDFNTYDHLILNEGINYKEGVYNFFGGVSERTIQKLKKLNDFKGYLYCFNENIDYNHMCSKRKELKDFSFNFRKPELLNTSEVEPRSIIIGDSHSLSIFKPGFSISRNDGKTLNGFLNDGIEKYINDSISCPSKYENEKRNLVFYAGNIDIRFHVDRYGGFEAIDKLINRLESQLKEIQLKRKSLNIHLCQLLPIEDESRKIPGTGKYKGNNFYGSKEVRSNYVKYFNSKLEDICFINKWGILKWGFDYSKGLSIEDMEARQSVHLRPSSYMFKNHFINKFKNLLF